MNPQLNVAQFRELAKKAGYGDQAIQSYIASKAPKPTRNRGGFLSSIISELGGAGGATGGMAIGASLGSVVPGIGTLIGGGLGGLIGGFAGGTVGRGVENKVRDDQNFFGEGGSAKKAFGEGALSGALGGLGAGASALRGVRAAGGLANLRSATGGGKALADASKLILKGGKKAGARIAGGGVDDLLTASKATAGRNTAERAGNSLYRSTLGVDDIVMPNATRPTTIFKADDLTAAARRIGLKGTPTTMKRQAATEYGRLSTRVSAELAKSKGSVPYSKLYKTAVDDVTKALPLRVESTVVKDEIVRSLQNTLLPLAKGGKVNATAINTFKNSLPVDSAFKKIAIGGNLTAKESADLALWSYADDLIAGNADKGIRGLAPTAKALTKEQSNLYGLAQGLGRMTRTPGDPKSMVDLVGRVVAPTVRKTQNAVGRGLMTAGGMQAGAGGVVPGGTAGLLKGAATRGVANNMFMPVSPDEEEAPAEGFDMGQDMSQYQAPQQSPYPLEAAIADMQRDPKNAAKYQAMYEFVRENSGGGGEGLNVTKPTSEKYAQANAGMSALNQLESLLSSDPGVLSRTRTPGRGLNVLGIGSTIKNATGTGEFDTLGFAAVDNMLRIATGAAAPDTEIRRYMNQYLPSAGDSPATVQTKLQTMRQQFESILNLAQPGGSGGTDLSSILQSLGAQGGY